jgi:hypothetical protein
MSIYLYLSLAPESLVASMLSPFEFGNYLAVGTEKHSNEDAIFFEVNRDLIGDNFLLSDIEKQCVPHPNGDPKHSIYISIYRAFEKTPLEAIMNLYLVTRSGRVLEIEQKPETPDFSYKYFLYQEIAPVHPRIVSILNPLDFIKFITDKERRLFVPKICFVDLQLGELQNDPKKGNVDDLPYTKIEHIRDCLIQLRSFPEKHTKTVDRVHTNKFPYRTIKNGFFIGRGEKMLYFPFPSPEELKGEYYLWWKSASMEYLT